MIEAYAIGVAAKLEDGVTPQLLKIIDALGEANGLMLDFTENLTLASKAGFGLSRNMTKAAAASTALGDSTGALARASDVLDSMALSSAAIARNMAMVRAEGGMRYGIGAGSGRRKGGLSGGEGVRVGPDGMGLSGASFGLGEAAMPAALLAGGLYASSKFYDAAKDYQTEVARLTMFGLDKAQMASAESYIAKLKTVGTSKAENMRFFTEAQGVFRESGMNGEHALYGAKLATPWLAQISYATAALDDASKASMQHSSLAMLRFIEQMGGVRDTATFNKYAEGGWKAIRASGGVVDWEQYRQFAARAGIAGQYIDPDVLFGELEPIIGELKGSTAGFAMRTAYNRIGGIIKIPNQVAHILADSGIWNKSKIEWNSMGGIKKFKGNPLDNGKNAMFLHRPVDFYEKEMLPMYAKMNHGKGLSREERARYNAIIYGATGGNLFNKIDQQLATIHKSLNSYNRTLGINESVKIADKTASGSEKQFTAAWTDFKKEFGTSMLPKITEMLKNGTQILHSLSAFSNANKSWLDAIGHATGGAPFGGIRGAASYVVDKAESYLTHGNTDIINPRQASGTIRHAPIHVNVHIDGKKISEHLTGGNNQTGPTGLNPSNSRMLPGTPILGH